MRRFVLIIITGVLSATVAFAASPPKVFFDEKINTYIGNRVSWGEVGELTQCLKDAGNSLAWEHADNSWILHSKNTDKLTKKVNKADWLFDYAKADDGVQRVYLSRVVFNKEEITPTAILSSSNVMACWKKEIEEAKVESKKQAARDETARISREKEEEQSRLAQVDAQKERDRLEFEAEQRKIESDEKVRLAEEARLSLRATQQAKVEAIEKQKKIARLSGHYENKQNVSAAVSRGSIDVLLLSDDKIKFSLHNKSTSASCDLNDQEATIEYLGKGNKIIRAVVGDENQARRNKDACYIGLNFKETSESLKDRFGYDYSVEIDQTGCKSYCGRGGTMLGRYIKIPK